jgi:thiol-disulfide isomerase/thioredoxin
MKTRTTAAALTALMIAFGAAAPALRAEDAAAPDFSVTDLKGRTVTLADYKGKVLVLNFWATWCGPCRTEMPTLQNLQGLQPDLAVVPVATGRNAVEGIRNFYAKAEVTGLPILRDPDGDLAHPMGVLGLPVTVIVNPEGAEVARLIGGAEWDSPEAQAVLTALMN